MISVLLSAMFYTHLEIKLDDPWTPSIDCVSFPENYTEPTYDFNEISQTDIGLKVQYWYIGIVYSLQILISIIYPVVAALLLYEIVKAARNAKKILSNRNSNEKHRTEKMIFVMTIFYVISSAPHGIMNFYMSFFIVDPITIIGVLLAYGTIFMSFLYCVTATSHSLICFGMSTEYRNTVRKVLGIKEVNLVVSHAPSLNTHS
ncbi:hypothetical protein CAEBREN_24283 [Caenorhabditis brenneri]|uniref:G-protein coupled receptors family 1 profile domain-containing protein n=1 Tax=Caenorhabditis brenneri TaxID=135651 RepID=G0M9S0_CAEBE|nr:hypothetical protein CAEBREN_24283 [Caenorhabditis brenneri]